MPLKAIKFGLAGGITISLTLFAIVWHVLLTNKGNLMVNLWEDMHIWYEIVPMASPLGSLVSLADGFGHGFVYFFLFAILYNWLTRKQELKSEKYH